MSKELGALEIFLGTDEGGIDSLLLNIDKYATGKMCLFTEEEYDIIKNALTPPTEEEVCKALSEHYDKRVIYEVGQFYVAVSKSNKCNVYNFVDINALKSKPYLITMIGSFYETRNKKKSSNVDCSDGEVDE